MADFKVTFASALIAASQATANAAVSITDPAKAFLIPAVTPFNTAGIGRETGAFNNSLLSISAAGSILNATTVQFDDGDASLALNNRCGAYLVEYTGPAGGANEVVVRAVTSVTMASGVDNTKDSAPILGIANINRCVPFMVCRGLLNSASYISHFADVDLVLSGSDIVARVSRSINTGSCICQIYVVEFLGSNWTVQKVNHVFAASNVDEDDAISSVGSLTQAFTYSSLKAIQGSQCAQQTVFAYLSSITNLRQRVRVRSTPGQNLRTWVISNPQLSVARYGTIDGVDDITITGTDPEVQNVTVTAVPDLTKALVLSYAGSNDVGGVNCAAVMWLCDLSTTTNVRMRRSNSVGATEYVHQVIDLSGMNTSFPVNSAPGRRAHLGIRIGI